MANIYNIVAEQFPQFVRADYPALVEFVTAYYKWLEIQSIGKLEDAVNIDTKMAAIQLQPTYDGNTVVHTDFVYSIVVGVSSGARAIVKRSYAANSTTEITLHIQYITVDAKFEDGEEIYVEQDANTPANNTIRANLLASGAESTIPSLFISQFKTQLDINGILTDLVPYNTRYLKHIKEIYSTKGSEQALLFLLRAVYQAEASVTYPNENILRTSDGQWSQETFMTISLYSGTMPSYLIDAIYLESPNSNATAQRITVTHYNIIDDSTVRVYYRTNANIVPESGQYVHIANPDTGLTTFRGTVIRSPAAITVVSGGANWRVGQAIRFPGVVKDTVARVAVVSDLGAIVSLEIVEYGLGHTEFQTVTVSPYKNKPIGVAYDVWPQLITNNIDHSGTGTIAYSVSSTTVTGTGTSFTTQLEAGSLIYGQDREYVGVVETIESNTSLTLVDNAPSTITSTSFRFTTTTTKYTITINDAELVASDRMVGKKGSTYVYVAPVTHVPYIRVESTGLSVSEWFESRATVQFEYGTTTTLKGEFLSDRGILSNRSIVIQDSYYYQQFSYVIESDVNQKVYSGLAAAVHPAGLKMFTKFALSTSIAIAPTAYTFKPLFETSFVDQINVDDALLKFLTKNVTDSVTAVEYISKLVYKPHTDSIVALDALSKRVTKAHTDSVTAADAVYKNATKNASDSVTLTEALSKEDVKAHEDEVTPEDVPSKDTTKPEEDEITAEDALSKVGEKPHADVAAANDDDYTFIYWDNTGLSKIRLNDSSLIGGILLNEDGGYMLLEDQNPDAPNIYKHLGDGTFIENKSTVVELYNVIDGSVIWSSAVANNIPNDITAIEESMTKDL